MDPGAVVSGNGTVVFSASPSSPTKVTLREDSVYGVSQTRITGRTTVNFHNSPTVDSFELSNGGLSGSGTVTVTDQFEWNQGTMSGDGETVVSSSGLLTISSDGDKRLLRSMTNYGHAVWTQGEIDIDIRQGSAVFNNVGTFEIQADGVVFSDSTVLGQEDAGPRLVNSGTLRKVTGTGNSAITAEFENSGNVEVQTGTLSVARGFTQVSGATIVASPARLSANSWVVVEAGTLAGSGRIDADVWNSGGFVTGALSIGGRYLQHEGGQLVIEIAGATANSQYDVLSVLGDASLGGLVVFRFRDGFSPSEGDRFDFLLSEGVIDWERAEYEVRNLAPGFEFDISLDAELGALQMTALTDGNFSDLSGVLGDLNNDDAVDAADAGLFFADWGEVSFGSKADFNDDGFVDAADAGLMFSEWTGDRARIVPEPELMVLPVVISILVTVQKSRKS